MDASIIVLGSSLCVMALQAYRSFREPPKVVLPPMPRIADYIDTTPPTMPPTPTIIEAPSWQVVEESHQEAEPTTGTGCVPCSRDHLLTVSGALSESLRFARSDGVEHPEVQRRLMLANEELNIMERIDASPEALAQSSEKDQQVMREFLPQIRELRHHLGEVNDVATLEVAAEEAANLRARFWVASRPMGAKVLELARKVQAGEMTQEDAVAELRGEVGDGRDMEPEAIPG